MPVVNPPSIGVNSISRAGEPALIGPVTLSAGENMTIVQSGQDISFAAAAGGPGGSVNIKQTEVDFGNVVSLTEKTFTITDADVGGTSQLLAQVIHIAPSDARSVDEIAWESWDIFCAPAAGSFDLTMKNRLGSVMGKFVVAYLVG